MVGGRSGLLDGYGRVKVGPSVFLYCVALVALFGWCLEVLLVVQVYFLGYVYYCY